MSPYHAAHIGCRIGAIFMFIRFAATASLLWQQAGMASRTGYTMPFFPDQAAMLITIVVYGLASFLMWDRAGWLAKVVAGPVPESVAVPPEANWGRTAFRAVGLFVFLDQLPSLVDSVRQKFFVPIPIEGADATFWTKVVIAVIALYVLIGADRLSAGARWYFNPSGPGDEDVTSQSPS